MWHRYPADDLCRYLGKRPIPRCGATALGYQPFQFGKRRACPPTASPAGCSITLEISRLDRTFDLSFLSYKTHEIGSGNFPAGAGTQSLDRAFARASCARRGRSEIPGRSFIARVTRERPCLARRRSRPGQNAHRQNNRFRYPNRIPAPAIHARSSTGGLDRHAYLQSA